jgi:hypothetical protein
MNNLTPTLPSPIKGEGSIHRGLRILVSNICSDTNLGA